MEIYLSHMAVFRVVEKLGLTKAVGAGWLQYFTTVVVVLAGTTVFAVVVKMIIEKVTKVVKIGEQYCAGRKINSK